MTQVITFGNFKGGVGKTSNATLVGYELSKMNKKVLIADLDPQGNATNILLNTKANIDGKVSHVDNSLMVSIENEDLSQSLVNIKDNLDLLASAPDFSLFPRYMEKYTDYNERVRAFNELLVKIKGNYDYVIIDTPPTISLITDSALYASDYCLVIMQTHEHSFEGAKAYIEYIQTQVIDTYKAPRLDVIGILAVLMQASAPVDEVAMQAAFDEFGDSNIFSTKIHYMQRIKRFGLTGITSDTMFDRRVFAIYDKVVKELIERIGVMENE
ncbi:ParA family protein [Apilactobacillus xinyiensis]|uniref:ParA family protein n=1 Tax=Apilactobacillus xinyiensis TaxID=2841032 RepID=UPI001C7D7A9A|nr:ParA family protein [Apilactobacillus xinyiensis]MCL0319194.1 AAA family ATPase [Apilactobacillus xinyiensis]